MDNLRTSAMPAFPVTRVYFLFFKAEQFGLFDQPVQVSGHSTKRGTFVAPYASTRKKRLTSEGEREICSVIPSSSKRRNPSPSPPRRKSDAVPSVEPWANPISHYEQGMIPHVLLYQGQETRGGTIQVIRHGDDDYTVNIVAKNGTVIPESTHKFLSAANDAAAGLLGRET
jgi:hypothetical protein